MRGTRWRPSVAFARAANAAADAAIDPIAVLDSLLAITEDSK